MLLLLLLLLLGAHMHTRAAQSREGNGAKARRLGEHRSIASLATCETISRAEACQVAARAQAPLRCQRHHLVPAADKERGRGEPEPCQREPDGFRCQCRATCSFPEGGRSLQEARPGRGWNSPPLQCPRTPQQPRLLCVSHSLLQGPPFAGLPYSPHGPSPPPSAPTMRAVCFLKGRWLALC